MSQRAGRHWVIAGVGLLILLVTNGLTATAITVFDESLLEEFGWSRSDLKFRDFINFTVVALFAPAAGWVLDKVGVRRMLVTGCLILSAAYFAYSRLTGLQQMYAIHVAFAFSLLSAGTMVVIVLVSSWFIERRGLAIGIALIGTSAGSFLLPPLNAELIARLGWRDTFALEAAFPLVLLGVILLLVRNSPVDEGLTPLGVARGGEDPRTTGLEFRQALKTRTFWAIGLSGFLTYYAILGLISHLFLHMRQLGFEPRTASLALSAFSLLAMLAKLAGGFLSDRLDRQRVFMGSLLVMFAGIACLATLRAGAWVWVAIGLIAVGWGGLYTLYNMLTVANFGLKAIGRINGTVSSLESLGVGLGIWLTGWLYDRFGDYQVPFLVLLACVALALLIGTQIRSQTPEERLRAMAVRSGN